MEREELEKLAWQKDPPMKSSVEQKLIYCIARALYADFSEGTIDQETARKAKEDLYFYVDMLQGLARSNSQIIRELSVLTAPRAQFLKKDKAELLDVIARIEAVVTGLIKKYDDVMPEFIRFRE